MGYQVPTDPPNRLQTQADAREDLLQAAANVLGVPEDHPWARTLGEQLLSTAMRGWEAFQQHRASAIQRTKEEMARAARQ